MKIYSVKPDDPAIRCSDGRTIKVARGIAWGKMCGLPGAYLAGAIISDVTGDEALATRYMQRFKWRTVEGWQKDMPHALTEDEVKAVIADIQKVEAENRPMIEKMQRERPQYVSDRADGAQEWGNNPDIKPNVKGES